MKKLLMGLMMAFAVTVQAEEVTVDGLKYTLDATAKTAAIVGYEVAPIVLDVGSVEYGGDAYAVTSVKDEVFQQCSTLTSVSLPKVVSIGEFAFLKCSSLTNAVLSSATSIGRNAFAQCAALESVALPLAETIGDFAFDACSQLKSISLPEATSIGGSAFQECRSLTNAVLPKVKTVEMSTFNNCGVVSLDLPSVTSIEMWAFHYCQDLSAISIPAVTSVGEKAFGYNDSLDVILTNEEMTYALAGRRSYYGLDSRVKILAPTKEEVEQATLKVSYFSTIGEVDVCEAGYRLACALHDLTLKARPQVVQEGEVAVRETELRAAKTEAVSIAGGVVTLAVNVCSNENFKVETKNWKPIELQPENVKVQNGRIVITIPVDSQQGFMILQSGDAKVAR